MFCSIIVPTIGHSSLNTTIKSKLNQTLSSDNFELIIVNDSSRPISQEEFEIPENIQIINTNHHERSVAHNTGAAIASGQYLHFLDDDDWMLPGAFNQFWQLAKDSPAEWLYGGFRLVGETGEKLTDILPDATGNVLIQMLSFEWLPLQASLVESKAFFNAGGFASLESLLGGFEDIDLSRQIVLRGDMSATNELVAVIRVGNIGSTTNYDDMFLQNRQSREKLLDSPEVFSRLWLSVRENSQDVNYWAGRIVYYYLGSLKWNLLHKRFARAASRGMYVLGSLIIAGRYLFSSSFWRALSTPHFNRVWLAIEEADASHIYDGVNWN